MGVSVIIVNYKTAGLVIDCLNSLSARDRSCFAEIMVVDNHSEDGLARHLSEKFPEVIFLDTGYNAGFARANNMAIRRAKGDAVLLLNADTIVTEDAIARCYQNLMTSAYVAAGVQLLNPDRSAQISGNYIMAGGLNYLLPLPYVGRFLRALALRLGAKKTNVPDVRGLAEVDWINGAFLMVKKSAIDEAGLLDEDFFLYAEEAEWCSRLRKVGKLCIYGDLHVIHLQGESAEAAFNSKVKGYRELSDKKGLQVMVSNFLRIRKEFGIFWLLFQFSIYLIAIPLSFLLGILDLSLIRNRNLFTRWQGLSANILRLTALLPRMMLGRPYFYKVL